ncbi:MAG: 3-methyl-2-oxobutanoate hydroxymethyltransferase [Fimbriimonadaceae bacterium]
MPNQVTIRHLRQLKAAGTPIVCVTAYDQLTATLAERAEVDLVLVGDSLGNVVQGKPTTLPVTMAEMVYHTEIVARLAQRALVVADLPFGSYGGDPSVAFENAVALMKAGAQAVKLEGPYTELIRSLVQAGIPVMGHLGFTPQSVHAFGGFRVQGRGEAGERIAGEAMALQEAGVFAVVLELMPADVARSISEKLDVPTIGIGAGAGCDGQIQVIHDALGLADFKPKHAKTFVEGLDLLSEGLRSYSREVRAKSFPTDEHSS